jgi:tetratricopeptide (TPR) repeat protein
MTSPAGPVLRSYPWGASETVTAATSAVTEVLMGDGTKETLLERAGEAAATGDWGQAYVALAEADGQGLLHADDLVLLANVAYAAGHLDVTIEAWERAHAESLRAGDPVAAAAAAVRVAMHLVFDTALMAPVRGWLARAERLLEGHEETSVHAWLAVVRNYERMLAGDFESARAWARRAIESGAGGDAGAIAIGRVAEARSLILEGKVRLGLALLDEAAVATVSGELDPLSTGVVYCEVVCALQGLAQYDQAEEWTDAMERWCQGNAVGSIHGRCRVHRAEILRLRGAVDQAEDEALAAYDELRPYLRRELGWPLTELGRIRLQRGDLRGAEEAFLRAQEAGWDPQPGLALVRLAQGEVEQAAFAIRDALEHPVDVPSKERPPNTDLRRAPLLAAQAEIAAAAGDLERARAAAEELHQVAIRFESKALAASAALARGWVALAEADALAAGRNFDEAARLWGEIGAPYEAGLARAALTSDRRASGRAATSPATDRAGDRVLAAGAFRREGEYWSVAFDGRTTRVRDLKGMRYLVRLLADPGREFHVVDLVAGESGGALASPGDAGAMLDTRAKEAYRRRIAEIEDDIEEARAMGDGERAAQGEVERDLVVRELSRAVGLGGRDRRAGFASERARASVTRAVRQAMVRISDHHPVLGEHLDRAIRTGTYCAYLPDPRAPVRWET